MSSISFLFNFFFGFFGLSGSAGFLLVGTVEVVGLTTCNISTEWDDVPRALMSILRSGDTEAAESKFSSKPGMRDTNVGAVDS